MPKNGDIRRVLGIDPGIASTGWAVVDFYKNRYACIAYGVIETKPSQIHGERLLMIFDKIEEIIQSYKPREAAMETLYFSKNVSSAMISEARSCPLCLQNHLICEIYAPDYKNNNGVKAKQIYKTILSCFRLARENRA